jgi:hypothetical protein
LHSSFGSALRSEQLRQRNRAKNHARRVGHLEL